MLATAPSNPPQVGQLVEVRSRPWVVGEIDAGTLSGDALRPLEGPQHLVRLRSVDEGAEPDETLEVIWEVEPGARILERAGLPEPEALDDPTRFAAFLDAVRWGASSLADTRHALAPFRSGVDLEAYQLDPLVRAIRMPRVSLLIADDVGLGKTIEAGLVAQELVLRYRARRILIVAPADLVVQWRDEMRDKFGLDFRIVDSALVHRLRRDRGVHANPWTHFPRLVTSIDYLKRERPMRAFRETLPQGEEPRFPRRWDLLIVDEAHHIAPSRRGHYATDSQRTAAIREITRHAEHRLFLSATPHNGFDESFTALLELLDDQRFARGVTPSREALARVMVRRMKSELPPRFDGTERFPRRKLRQIEVSYTPQERQAHADLRRYAALRTQGVADGVETTATAFVLQILKKRLLSSPAAFAGTLARHRTTIEESRRASRPRPSQRHLQTQIDRAEEAFSDEVQQQGAEDEALTLTARLFRPLTAEERGLLDGLAAWAERAAAQPDAKARALIEEIEAACRPEGAWCDERLIVFTEYRDTQGWLFDLLAGAGLTQGGRVELLHGGLADDRRAELKAAFQADPAESPVRVLLATDAASEGINLQRHCRRVLHYEIPWNPNRLEQRNGRVDRHGQTRPPLIAHFVPQGWERLADVELVPENLDGELELLRQAVEKVERMRDMLGRVGPVIAEQVSEAMLGRRRSLDTRVAERDGEAAKSRLRFERDLARQLAEITEAHDATRAELRLTPAHIHQAVAVGLDLAGQPALRPAEEEGTFTVPDLHGAWAACTIGLAHPFHGSRRPITFDAALARGRDDLVLCHLGHRLAQMALRLMRAEVFQAGGRRLLNRVSAGEVATGTLRDPVAVVHARLVVTGADGHRLHEELIQAGGEVREGRLRRTGVGVTALRDALALPVSGPAPQEIADRLLALHPALVPDLMRAVEARTREVAAGVEGRIAKALEAEIAATRAVLNELAEAIRRELAAEPPSQLSLWAEDERDQRARDRAHLADRLEQIPAEIEREVAVLRRRYDGPSARTFPVAVEYRVPRGLR